MKFAYVLIILTSLFAYLVHIMVVSDGFEHLKKLLQKALRCKHHQLNHKEIHCRVVITKDL